MVGNPASAGIVRAERHPFEGDGWWNTQDVDVIAEEMADECTMEFLSRSRKHFSGVFNPSSVTLNGKAYTAKSEYNNTQRACTTYR